VQEYRNFDDPKYKEWRLKVYKRDGFTCRLCGATGTGIKLEAHHIIRWADAVELRYVVTNGITLCKQCHDHVKDREDEFAPRFILLVKQKRNKKKDRNDFIEIKLRMRDQ
jgi:5-methylcytosine-specific restriction endonuclease McrA